MSEASETVRQVLSVLASTAGGFASMGTGPYSVAASAAAGLLDGVSDLLKHRTPEEVRQLVYELVANPAKKIDLSDAEREVARILAQRRRAEENR
jgi:hypothetical protein